MIGQPFVVNIFSLSFDTKIIIGLDTTSTEISVIESIYKLNEIKGSIGGESLRTTMIHELK